MNFLKYRDMAYGNPKGVELWRLVRGGDGEKFAGRLRNTMSRVARVPGGGENFRENFFLPLVGLMVYEFGIGMVGCMDGVRAREVATGIRESLEGTGSFVLFDQNKSLALLWPIEILEVDKWLDLMNVRIEKTKKIL